ncbi:MAG TPA: hypothetical protein VF460_01115 [Burkholderiales bacterium]
MKSVSFLLFGAAMACAAARADCQQQLQLLGADLKGVTLTETQKQDLGGLIDDARRYCWVQQERTAMVYISRARRAAGLRPPPDESDWETVPLESLEQR